MRRDNAAMNLISTHNRITGTVLGEKHKPSRASRKSSSSDTDAIRMFLWTISARKALSTLEALGENVKIVRKKGAILSV